MNRFTNINYVVPLSYTRAEINNMIRWCNDHISLRGNKWDLDTKWIPQTMNRLDVSRPANMFIFENDDDRLFFILANIDRV